MFGDRDRAAKTRFRRLAPWHLLNGAGYFHRAHRAVDDCHTLLEILSFELPTTGTSALAVLLERARKKTMRLWAEQSPFDLKDVLKRRGYRWSDGADGRPRSSYVDLDESRLDEEIAFFKKETYLRDVEPSMQTLTAFDRFSVAHDHWRRNRRWRGGSQLIQNGAQTDCVGQRRHTR
jgi:hypothetical protein